MYAEANIASDHQDPSVSIPEMGLLARPEVKRVALTVVAPSDWGARVVRLRYNPTHKKLSVIFSNKQKCTVDLVDKLAADLGGGVYYRPEIDMVHQLLSMILTVDIFHGDSEQDLAKFKAHTDYVVKLS
jgi:hypothetical protein